MEQRLFTKYEIARIIGARALQIAMDAPLLLKIPEADLAEMKFDALQIAEREFKEDVLPISISRPTPRKGKDKLTSIKEEKVTDAEIIKKGKEIEEEISENLKEYSLVEEEEKLDDTTPEKKPDAPQEQ